MRDKLEKAFNCDKDALYQKYVTQFESALLKKQFYHPYKPIVNNKKTITFNGNPSTSNTVYWNTQYIGEIINQYNDFIDYLGTKVHKTPQCKILAQKGIDIMGGFLETVGAVKESEEIKIDDKVYTKYKYGSSIQSYRKAYTHVQNSRHKKNDKRGWNRVLENQMRKF